MHVPNTDLHNYLKQNVNLNDDNYLVIKENWESVINTVTKTHNLLKQYNYLAFDIAINHKKPIIIEINHNWDVCILQRVTKTTIYLITRLQDSRS